MIPKRFELVNRKWLVRMVTTKQLQKHIDKHPMAGDEDLAKDLQGLCDPQAARIFINKDLHTDQIGLLHTFCHELVHAIKFANGETGHCEEEVDRIGGFVAQILQTARSK